jgi:hypothetical protein
MSQPPRPIRPLPSAPAPDTDQGLRTGLTTRILIVATIVLGQLWALTVGLEEYLAGHADRAWWLAGFSVLSFLVTAALVWLEPPTRDTRRGRR